MYSIRCHLVGYIAVAAVVLSACGTASEKQVEAERGRPLETDSAEELGNMRLKDPKACEGINQRSKFLQSAKSGDVGRFVVHVFDISGPTAATGEPVFLNIGDRYPRQSASVVAFTNGAPDVAQFMREQLRGGDYVCASGTVRFFRGRPQLVVDSLDDLVLMFSGSRIDLEELKGRREALRGIRQGCIQAFEVRVDLGRINGLADQQRLMYEAALLMDWPTGAGLEIGTGGAIAAQAIANFVDVLEEASLYLYEPPGAPEVEDSFRGDVMKDVFDAARSTNLACRRLN